MNGTNDPDFLGWTGRVCAAVQNTGHALTYYNLGIRRDTTSDIRKRWMNEVSCRLPADIDGRLVFSFGVNDTTIEHGETRVAPARSSENARHILSSARKRYPTLMVGPPPTGSVAQNVRIAQMSHELQAICAEVNVAYLDVYAHLMGSETWMHEVATYDGSHPGSAGYSKLADLISSWDAWLAWFK